MTNIEAKKSLEKLQNQIWHRWWNDIALNEEEDPDEYNDALVMAEDALEKEDKYRWRDLRKNPEDLPVKFEDVFILYKSELDGTHYYNLATYTGESWNVFPRAYIEKVIAWKYWNPFEEVD